LGSGSYTGNSRLLWRCQAQARLEEFLGYACAATPFYKKFAGAKDLRDFPVIDKNTIRESYDDFLSSAYDKNDLFASTTSGSYGAPFIFCLSKDKRARQQAEVIYFNGWVGYEVGMPYVQVRVEPRGRLLLFMQNGVMMDPSVIDKNWLEKQRQVLRNGRIEFISGGYPSAVAPIAEYCRSKGDKPGDFVLKGIITGAEPLGDSDREIMEEVFGCIVLDRYSSSELGVVSHECATCKTHHINFISHKIELLAIDGDEPVEPGEVGRVVVTDLFSHGMPLIRYDTGDLSAWATKECLCGMNVPTFEKVGGRAIETVYDPSGKMVSSLAIVRCARSLINIIEYRFIQKTQDSYICKLHVMPSFKEEDIFRERLRRVLGLDAHINFEYVDSIPPLASGKRPYVINESKRSSGG
jgi:phenylacetate-CoA ligase